MEITFFGHACFQVLLAGKKLLFDPFIRPNEQASGIDISSIKPDYIILSHGHGDHVADVQTIYNQSEAQVVSNFEVVNWFINKGVKNAHAMNHGGERTFDFGKLKMVNAIHTSSMPDGSYGGNPAGFVVSGSEGSFYYAGDTALTFDMKLIKDEFSLDFALLPIGNNFTMGYRDAVKAAEFVGAKKIIGLHYNTFPHIEINTDDAISAFQKSGIELILMEIGETINI